MADELRPVDTIKWESAKSEVESWLIKTGVVLRELMPNELATYKQPSLIFGWRFETLFESGQVACLDLLLPLDFPWTPPRVALVNRPPFREWPHIEENGLLCLISAAETLPAGNALVNAKTVISRAVKLLDEISTGDNSRAFKAEFHSYWPSEKPALIVRSLATINGPDRFVSVLKKQDLCLIADNKEILSSWLRNFRKSNREQVKRTDRGIFINIPNPLTPDRYPKTINDIFVLLGSRYEMLIEIAQEIPRTIVLLIVAPSEAGNTVCGVILEAAYRTEGCASIFRGFRKSKMPMKILCDRYFRSVAIRCVKVQRVDGNWVHGRDSNPDISALSERRIGMIGCGSLGSQIAYNLAQSGVGSIHLIDPDVLSAANTGRHLLGARDVGHFKAEALAKHIVSNFPHIKSVTFDNKSWQESLSREGLDFNEFDLIISTIGNWASESALNAWQIKANFNPPILYGWTEPYAVAGHAVLVCGDAGCFACNMSEHGDCHSMVTEWPKGTGLKTEPGCGAFFQPYGPLELSHSAALISELALDYLLEIQEESTHRIWAARQKIIEKNGGKWSEFWSQNLEWLNGGREVDITWPQDGNCKVCKIKC